MNVQEYVEHISAKGFENLHELTKKKSLKKQSYIYIYKLKVCFCFQLHPTTTSSPWHHPAPTPDRTPRAPWLKPLRKFQCPCCERRPGIAPSFQPYSKEWISAASKWTTTTSGFPSPKYKYILYISLSFAVLYKRSLTRWQRCGLSGAEFNSYRK